MRISTLATQSFPQSWFTKSPSSSPGARAAARRGPRRGSAGSGPGGSGRACGASQARQTVGIRVARSTTERLVWHCGEHTAKLESVWRSPACSLRDELLDNSA